MGSNTCGTGPDMSEDMRSSYMNYGTTDRSLRPDERYVPAYCFKHGYMYKAYI
jgi:hypothetical protein